MNLKDKALAYLVNHSDATNQDLAEVLGVDTVYARGVVSKLKKTGRIEVEGESPNRNITILEKPASTIFINKRERYDRQLDFLEDIMFSDVDPKYRLEASAQHIRILNKL